jgi:hypothetical protein
MKRSRLASVLGTNSFTALAASLKLSSFVDWLGLLRLLRGFGDRVLSVNNS